MWRGVVVVGACLTLGGCGFSTRRAAPPLPSRPGATQQGVASWYGPGFHGEATTSGEIYDQYSMTAAHPTLPLGTRVDVTNLLNARTVEVRINDRGPFVGDRVIDLSYAAAQKLDMIGPGTAPVRIEVLDAPGDHLPTAAYAVQVGAFADFGNATELQRRLSASLARVYIAPVGIEHGRYYRVRVGPFANRQDAIRAANALTGLGLRPVVMEDGIVAQ